MTRAGLPRQEVPADTPGALLLGGLRRGALLVFVPVALAAQAVAWLAYAISHWYHPWSWFKIGLAYALASVRVPFVATVTGGGLGAPRAPVPLELAIGALTVAVLVLAFRAGREQARGLERRPLAAGLAGSAVGLGFALPMFVAALLVTLGFPQFGVASMHPRLWAALVLPLVVGGAAGTVGGLAVARERLVESRVAVAADATRGGALALWWGLVLAFVAFLVAAAVQTGATTAYARGVQGWGGGGALLVVHHFLLLPNQSALVLAMTTGSPVHLDLLSGRAAEATLREVTLSGDAGSFLRGLLGIRGRTIPLPGWFALFYAVPAAATVLGGRRAGVGAPAIGGRVARGVLAGVVFAILAALSAWAASITLPVFAPLLAPSIGTALPRTFATALAWGVVGCTVGALVPERPTGGPASS
ncbi:MAG: DUF6350 family protein [Planctomycetaceae bacterium]